MQNGLDLEVNMIARKVPKRNLKAPWAERSKIVVLFVCLNPDGGLGAGYLPGGRLERRRSGTIRLCSGMADVPYSA